MQRPALLLSKSWILGRTSLMSCLHTRQYVGISQTEPALINDTVDRSLKSTEQSTATTSSTVSSAGQDAASTEYGFEPAFQIVSSGVGAALLVKLPPQTEITAFTGSALSISSHVSSQLILDGNMSSASGRSLAGGSLFYQKLYTKQQPGDILLAPQRMGEITTIQLRGLSKYILRRDAFLAKTGKVTLAAGMDGVKGKYADLTNKLVHTVTGSGTIAISHYGGLYRISLAAGEEYLANPRNLVFWESRTAPTRLYQSDPIVPSPYSPWRRYAFVRYIAENPFIQSRLQNMKTIAKSFRNLILGVPDLVKLKGPGDFYIASRVEPKFEKSRLTNAFATVNDSTSQLFEQASIFPDQAPHQDETTQHLAEAAALSKLGGKMKRHPHYAEKSIHGKPSFYVEIGPDRKARFVSTKE